MPHEIAVSPDGKQAAVVSYGGNSIDIIDIASRTRSRTIDLGACILAEARKPGECFVNQIARLVATSTTREEAKQMWSMASVERVQAHASFGN